MKPTLQFLRTTLVGGLLFLAPIMVLIVLLGKALALAHKLVDPVAEILPFESVIGLKTPLLLAIAVIVFVCFLAGFLARTVLAQKFVGRLESSVLSIVPGYEFFKRVGESMLGVQRQAGHEVALVRIGDAWQLGFVVERLTNGLVAVFIPDAPNPDSGSVYFTTPERVNPADAPPASALKCLRRMGAGAGALLGGFATGPTGEKPPVAPSPPGQSEKSTTSEATRP